MELIREVGSQQIYLSRCNGWAEWGHLFSRGPRGRHCDLQSITYYGKAILLHLSYPLEVTYGLPNYGDLLLEDYFSFREDRVTFDSNLSMGHKKTGERILTKYPRITELGRR